MRRAGDWQILIAMIRWLWMSLVTLVACTASPPAPTPAPAPAVEPVAPDLRDPGTCDAIYGYALDGDRCHPLNGCGCPPAGCGPGVFTSRGECEAHAGEPRGAPAPAAPASAQADPAAQFLAGASVCRDVVVAARPSCAREWTEACAAALLDAAYMGVKSRPRTGGCYYHDRAGCPGCTCPYYVKVDQQGFDGGTGCLSDKADVLAQLYTACAAGRCQPK